MSVQAFSLRTAAACDIAQVAAMEADTLARWNHDSFAEELALADSLFIVAETCGKIAGFIIARHVGDEAEIFKIAVAEPFRLKGIGKSLIEEVIRMLSAAKVYLEVAEKNLGAISFYRRYGFNAIGSRRNYYDGDNAILMEWKHES